jgi:hypothetical protein
VPDRSLAPHQEARVSDCDPIEFRPRASGKTTPATPAASHPSASHHTSPHAPHTKQICFNRIELNEILAVYGRQVAAGEWRDYAMDFNSETAVFSIYRRASEVPLYRVEKNPKLARKQGAYSVIAANGLVLKRGEDLKRVLGVLEKPVKLVNR